MQNDPTNVPVSQPLCKNLFEAFAKAQASFRTPVLNREAEVKKDGKLLYKTKYADIQEIIDCIRKPLSENGLSFFQVTEQAGANWYLVLELAHSSGEVKRSVLPLNVNQANQQLGGSLTYLKRYQLSAFFGIAADFDDDGNATGDREAEFKEKTPAGATSKGVKNHAPQSATSPQSPPTSPQSKPLTDPPKHPKQKAAGPSEAQLKRLYAIGKNMGWNPLAIRIYSLAHVQRTPGTLSNTQYDQLCTFLEGSPFDHEQELEIVKLRATLTPEQVAQLE